MCSSELPLVLNRLPAEENCDHRILNFSTGHAHLPSRTPLRLYGTHCLLPLKLLTALVLLVLDLKLTYLQKPMSPNVYVTQCF